MVKNKLSLILFLSILIISFAFIIATSPTISSVTTTPSGNVSVESNIQGFCNVGDADGGKVGYSWKWFNESVIYSSYINSDLSILNDSTPSGNISFTTNQNLTKYLKLPLSSVAIFGSMNLTGFNSTSATLYRTENVSGSISGTYSGDATNFNDENISTCVSSGINQQSIIIQEWQINPKEVNWRFEHYSSTSNSGNQLRIYFYNFNTSSYDLVYTLSNAMPKQWYSHSSRNVLENHISGTNFTVKLVLNSTSTSAVSHCEGRIAYNTKTYPNETWLEIGSIDSIREWNNSGDFSSEIELIDFKNQTNIALNNGSCDCSGCIISSNNCLIPLTFHSDGLGKIEYSNINITYLNNSETQGTNKNLVNISSSITSTNQNWTFSCRGYDGETFTAWTNATKNLIINSNPTINNASISVLNAFASGTVWAINKSTKVIIQNLTPIVNFTTAYDSDCAISLENLNYTAMILDNPSTDCGSSNSTSHVCLLPSNELIKFATNTTNIYISCLSSDGVNIDSTGAMVVAPIPYLQNELLTDAHFLDLTEDGTNYGQVSEGWVETGESKIKQINLTDTSSDHYLLVKITRLDASINLSVNGQFVGLIPSDSGGAGQWDYYIFRIDNSYISSTNNILISSFASNTDNTYIDFIALVNVIAVADNTVPENNVLVYWLDVTNQTLINIQNWTVWTQSGSVYGTNTSNFNKNAFTSTYLRNKAYVFETPQANSNFTFGYQTNFTNYGSPIYSQNKSIHIDNSSPSITSITTTLNVLQGAIYSTSVNVTDDDVVSIILSTNDGSFSNKTLSVVKTLNKTVGTGNINYTKANTKNITITVTDSADHISTFNYLVYASNVSIINGDVVLNKSFDYNTTFFNITDTSTNHDLTFKLNYSITTIGTANITQGYNHTYTILDGSSAIKNIVLYLSNGTVDSARFSDYTTNLNWSIGSFDNSLTSPILLQNKIEYTLNKSLTLEWENSGVDSVRLFYVAMANKNQTLNNITVHLPLRTTYISEFASLDLFVCSASTNWGTKTCGVWTEITSLFYNSTDTTYHWGSTQNYFPVVDVDSDGSKDTIFLKIPSVSGTGALMFKVQTDNENAEINWTPAPADAPTEDAGSQEGGGVPPVKTFIQQDTSTALKVESLKTEKTGFLSNMWNGFVDILSNGIAGIANIYLRVKTGFTDVSIFFLMLAITVVALIAITVSPENSGIKASKKLFRT